MPPRKPSAIKHNSDLLFGRASGGAADIAAKRLGRRWSGVGFLSFQAYDNFVLQVVKRDTRLRAELEREHARLTSSNNCG
jgi:hypothetical protein